jgi:hypothetical protein
MPGKNEKKLNLEKLQTWRRSLIFPEGNRKR